MPCVLITAEGYEFRAFWRAPVKLLRQGSVDRGMAVGQETINSNSVQQLSRLVHDALAKHSYESAVFFADKLFTLDEQSPVATYTLAQAYYMSKQYRRALNLLKRTGLHEQDLRCCYLAALCLAETRCWEECLNILGGWDESEALDNFVSQMDTTSDVEGQQISLKAAVLLQRGKAYDALDNQQRAIRWYKAALRTDPFCYEAFQLLVGHHMLSSKDEIDLVENLPLQPQHEWLRMLYRAKCKKYDQHATLGALLDRLEAPTAVAGATLDNGRKSPESSSEDFLHEVTGSQTPHAGSDNVSRVKTRSMAAKSKDHGTVLPSPRTTSTAMLGTKEEEDSRTLNGCGFADNLDVLICRADWLHHVGAYQEAFQMTCSILEADPYAIEAMPLHLTAAVELKHKNELFLRAHRLVEEYPEYVVSWFAVACYYLCTRQYEIARRYFGKATSMDTRFAPAWIGFGHSFAFQDESDQAMAAYRTAARLLPGLHVPLLGMGMEYQRMNNLALAEQLLLQAHATSPADPMVCNELGILAHRHQKFSEAEQWFMKALDRLPAKITAAWEPILNNLAHVYRKQQRYHEAEDTYLKALSLLPGQASTLIALAYTYHLRGSLQEAILYYHKGLGVRPEDGFAKEMLTLAVKEECEQSLSQM